MLSAVYKEPAFIQEKGLREIRSSASEQPEFIKAVQSCDLENILKFLEKGEVNPFEVIEPADELARQLFSINEKKHFIPYPQEEAVKLEDFSKDCTMQAWMLISIFSDEAKEDNLKTRVFSKVKKIVGDDYKKKHQELSEEIKRKQGSIGDSPIQDIFNDSYHRQMEALAKQDKEVIKAINKKDG